MKDSKKLLNTADIGIPPRHEGFGITVLNSMLSEAIIIASNTDGNREIVSNGKNGIMFKPDDAEDLSKTILAFCHDLDSRKNIT